MLLSLTNICQSSEKDSIKIAITDIRLLNKVFADYNRLQDNTILFTKINAITYNYITSSRELHNIHVNQLHNMNSIVYNTKELYNLQIKELESELKKTKFTLYGVSGISLLIIILTI